MTMRERTAYPILRQKTTSDELAEFFTPTKAEIMFVNETARGKLPRLQLTVYLKCFQRLGYLPQANEVPHHLFAYVAQQTQSSYQTPLFGRPPDVTDATRSRYRQAIHHFLEIKPYRQGGQSCLKPIIKEAAQAMSDPADLINVAIEQLIVHRFELPAYSTLDRYVNHIRFQIEERLFNRATARLSSAEIEVLDGLLKRPPSETRYPFTRLKSLPATATLQQMYAWEKQLIWLEDIIDPQRHLTALRPTKIAQFATQAYQMEAGDMLDITTSSRRLTLLLCLVDRMQRRVRDQLGIMILRRIALMHRYGKKQLQLLRERHQTLLDQMVNTLDEIVTSAHEPDDAQLGYHVRIILDAGGGVTHYEQTIQQLTALQNNNYLPLLRSYCRDYRSILFRVTDQLKIKAAAPDPSLQQLLSLRRYLFRTYNDKEEEVKPTVSFTITSLRWRKLIIIDESSNLMRRIDLEAYLFSQLADGLGNGDLYIVGSDRFADYRTQLIAWETCEPMVTTYCTSVGLSATGDGFTNELKAQLMEKIADIDIRYSEQVSFYFGTDGKPHLRKADSGSVSSSEYAQMQEHLKNRMPDRHLLDLLAHVHHWHPYTRHFSPPSGIDPKIQNRISLYLLTIFCYGCNLGPTQTVHHLRKTGDATISTRILGRLNKQHITTEKLDAALRDIVNEYARFPLINHWGNRHLSVTDGTHYQLIENNLLGERHIRYGAYGGIAYHHISDTYIALFSHFIACGVWEAVYILDGLLKNKSVMQPKTVHADTQGQSEVVFGLAFLLGIELMPLMRNWNKVTMYRPTDVIDAIHLKSWFTRTVNWELIEAQWPLLMQVALSIQKGKVLPSWLLQKLNSDNPKNKLYLALREVGRVRRTLFLLDYVSESSLRRQIQAATTKIESYNRFSQWIFFGGEEMMTSRDPVEYEKRIKYKDLIANAIMLHNVVDIIDVLNQMSADGFDITPEFVAMLSPYMTRHLKRFGEYVVDTTSIAPDFQPDKPFLANNSP